ncbi:hypothetical protein AC1031_000457 [Aphanomyces cochlioides]|nr:hypothetical protein AC1031_000457 [Aphanomyces cochlioides]
MKLARAKKKSLQTTAPVTCSAKEITIQRCPDQNESDPCVVTQKEDNSCDLTLAGGTTGSFRIIDSVEKTLRIYKTNRTKSVKFEYLPQGFANLEFYLVRRLELHDIVLPEGLHSIRFKFTNLPSYPSDKFRNITLPKTIKALYFEELKLDSLDPSEWRDVPLKSLKFFRATIQSFDHVLFPPSITTLQIRYGNITTLETSTLPTSLKALNLEYNQLTRVGSIPMNNLHDMTYLILDGNPIQSLEDSSNFPSSLHNLSMASCGLTNISDKFEFPPNLVSLDLSDNNLTSFSFEKLPKSLTTLDLDSNPLKELNVDDQDTLEFLKNLHSFDATTYKIECKPSYTKMIVRGKIYACVSKDISVQVLSAAKPKMTPTTTAFIVVLVCVVAIALIMVFVLRVLYRRRGCHTKHCEIDSVDESSISSLASFESSNMSNLSKKVVIARVVRGEDDRSKSSNPSDSVVSMATGQDPSFISNDSTLMSYSLDDDSVHDLIPMMGNVSSGVYNDQRVMLVALPLHDGEATAHLLVQTKHPKLLTFHGFVHGLANETLVVMEWMDGGSLDALLCKSLLLGFMQKIVIALDVIAALVYLHDTDGSSHCHLSTHTIWLTDAGRAKLSLVSGVQPSETIWQPETESEEKSPSTDVYSFGVLLLSLQRQSVPSIHDIQAARSLMSKDGMEILSIDWFRLSSPDKLRTLASRCLQLEASRRPSASDIHTAIRAMMDEVLEAEMASDVQSTVLQSTVLESIAPPPSTTISENPVNSLRESEEL